jgi:redox-sensitive bicupin YhaK (pirin superfamily)
VSGDIPEVVVGDTKVRVIAGELEGVKGPVEDLVVEVEYLDVDMRPGSRFIHGTSSGDTVFAYMFQGEAGVDGSRVDSGSLVVFKEGGSVEFNAGANGARFLLVSGEPLNEPVAWRGPIVMNTQDELDLAFRELRDGTFIKE